MQTVDEKKVIVDTLSAQVEESSGVYLADFTGIDVETVTAFRVQLREKGLTMQVVKNTLLKRVFDNCKITGLGDHLVGPSSLILADSDDPSQPAKILVDFYKENPDLLPIKGIQVEGEAFSGEKVKEFSKMPGRVELQAQVVSLAMGASGTLIGLIKGPGGQIAGQIEALVKKLEG